MSAGRLRPQLVIDCPNCGGPRLEYTLVACEENPGSEEGAFSAFYKAVCRHCGVCAEVSLGWDEKPKGWEVQ